MHLTIDRRRLMLGGSLGLGTLVLAPGAVFAQQAAATGFTHAVASGELGPDSMLLWTRHVPPSADEVRLDAEIALDPEFAKVVSAGSVRTGAWQDPSATMLGSTQESWLAHCLKSNARSTAWQLVGMGTIIGRILMPKDAPGWLKPDASERVVNGFRNDVRAARHGLPMWMDRWDGYPIARSRLLHAAQRADADLVMLAGDSHNAWAFSLVEDGRAAGVEFAGHSVTSGGLEGSFAADPRTVVQGFVATNPELAWADASRRGYMMIEITPKGSRATGSSCRPSRTARPRLRTAIACTSNTGAALSRREEKRERRFSFIEAQGYPAMGLAPEPRQRRCHEPGLETGRHDSWTGTGRSAGQLFCRAHPEGARILDWSRAEVALMRPTRASRAIEGIIRDLIATRDGATYFAE